MNNNAVVRRATRTWELGDIFHYLFGCFWKKNLENL